MDCLTDLGGKGTRNIMVMRRSLRCINEPQHGDNKIASFYATKNHGIGTDVTYNVTGGPETFHLMFSCTSNF